MPVTTAENTSARRRRANPDAATPSTVDDQLHRAGSSKRFRLAIVAPHVVQYHSPLYRKLASSELLDVHVYYLDRTGSEATYDPTMAKKLLWDIDLLDGHDHEFVPNRSPKRTGSGFFQRVNPGLFTRLRRGRWDAVLVQGYQPFSSWLAMLTAKATGSKVIYRGEATLPANSGVKEFVKKRLLHRVFALSDAVLYSCSGNRAYYEHYGCPSDKLSLIPCAVDNEFFRQDQDLYAAKGLALREAWGFSPDLPVILNVSRLDGYKNQTDLINAAASLQASGIEAGVVLVGDGPDRTMLEEQTRRLGVRRVHFAGFVNQREIRSYYAAADIFALCSKVDPSPKAVNEALNFSLPLACSNRPGTVGDVIIQAENALTYNPGDASGLAACLQELIENPSVRKKLGMRSLELVEQWTLDADVRAIEGVLQRLFPNR